MQSFSQATDQEAARLKNHGDGFLNETIFIHQMNAGYFFSSHENVKLLQKFLPGADSGARHASRAQWGVTGLFLHLPVRIPPPRLAPARALPRALALLASGLRSRALRCFSPGAGGGRHEEKGSSMSGGILQSP